MTTVASPAAVAAPPAEPPASAVRQFGWLFVWQIRRGATQLPLLILVQSLLAVGAVIGYGFILGDVPKSASVYLVTGAPTLTLMMVGLVMTPQMVAQSKLEGAHDWMRTLPVPRIAFLAADLAMWTLVALPGVLLAVGVGAWRFGLVLSPAPWVVGAAVGISLVCASVGYAIASLAKPLIAMLISQLLVFVTMLFSPLLFPVSNFPSWLASVHRWLPFEPAANLMRAGLDQSTFAASGRDWAVLAIWAAACALGAGLTLRARD